MRVIDCIVAVFSWTVLAVVAGLAVAKRCGFEAVASSGAAALVFTVLTAAAVGYVTNQLAVFLLFRPYRRHFGIQGLVPRKKARLAQALGEMIPAYLLDPAKITGELGSMVRDTLDKPELLDELRTLIGRFGNRYSREFSDFLTPHIVHAAERAVADNLSSETLRKFFDTAVGAYLSERANREQLATGVIDELKRRAPEFSAFIRNEVRSGAADYVRCRHPRLAAVFSADEFAARMVDYLDWPLIQKRLEQRFSADDTRAAVSDELVTVSTRLRDYFASEECNSGLTKLAGRLGTELNGLLRDYLAAELPGMLNEMLQRDELWLAVRETLLPLLQNYVDHYLRRGGSREIEKRLDLAGRVERSVNDMDVRKLHAMVKDVSGEELTAIQLLGFVLGGIAGFLLVLAV